MGILCNKIPEIGSRGRGVWKIYETKKTNAQFNPPPPPPTSELGNDFLGRSKDETREKNDEVALYCHALGGGVTGVVR